jgi:hypothetical protein
MITLSLITTLRFYLISLELHSKNKNPSNLLGLVLVVNGWSLSHQLRPYPPQALGLVLAEEGCLKVRNSSTFNYYTPKNGF